MRIFDIIGPTMIGPSSSHTAGACRISRAAKQILNEEIRSAEVELHGSFAVRPGQKISPALVAGLLGYETDNMRIHNSLEDLKIKGINLFYRNQELEHVHINTARYTLTGQTHSVCVTASSIGGGLIEIVNINGAELLITGGYNTKIVFARKLDGLKEQISEILGNSGITKFGLEQAESGNRDTGIILIKTRDSISESINQRILELDGVIRVTEHSKFE